MGEEEGGWRRRVCVFFFDFLVPPWGLVHGGDAGFAGFFPFCVQGLGYEGVPSLWGGQHQRYPWGGFWFVQEYPE